MNGTGNVEVDDTEWLNSIESNEALSQSNSNVAPSQNSNMALSQCQNMIETGSEMILLESEDLGFEEAVPSCSTFNDAASNFEDIDDLQEDALEYIAGYIIQKQNLTEFQCNQNSFTWVDEISKGFLKKPSNQFVSNLKQLENILKEINKKTTSFDPKLQHTMILDSTHFKCRINFRIRDLNKRSKVMKAKQRIMGGRKLIKINL